jgi:N-acetylglucosaminyldiphosphoundecaprenol N-acetyl-beta-D-mannosaminyltransferase
LTDYRERQDVVGTSIDVVYWGGAVATLLKWAAAGESRYVCACNVHSVVTAQRDEGLAAAMRGADMVVPDGEPVAWLMRKAGFAEQQRVAGPDLMWRYFASAAPYGESIFLYGGTPHTLERLRARIAEAFPGLRVAGVHSPPFRPLTPAEDQAVVDAINRSGATTVWVSLGCPKQELWMAEHHGRVRSVLIGVGAAFAFHTGQVRRAPRWMQRHSLEWLHRLVCEPRRLWRRYAFTNTVFAIAVMRRLLKR